MSQTLLSAIDAAIEAALEQVVAQEREIALMESSVGRKPTTHEWLPHLERLAERMLHWQDRVRTVAEALAGLDEDWNRDAELFATWKGAVALGRTRLDESLSGQSIASAVG